MPVSHKSSLDFLNFVSGYECWYCQDCLYGMCPVSLGGQICLCFFVLKDESSPPSFRLSTRINVVSCFSSELCSVWFPGVNYRIYAISNSSKLPETNPGRYPDPKRSFVDLLSQIVEDPRYKKKMLVLYLKPRSHWEKR